MDPHNLTTVKEGERLRQAVVRANEEDFAAVRQFVRNGINVNGYFDRVVQIGGLVWPICMYGVRWTPLVHFATNPAMLELLVKDLGADINQRGEEGNTAIFDALVSTHAHPGLLDAMVTLGADEMIPNNLNVYPLQFAADIIIDIREGWHHNREANADTIQGKLDECVAARFSLNRVNAQTAFVMGLHPRLGDASQINVLGGEAVRIVLETYAEVLVSERMEQID
jgi:hypothetical protein